MKSLVLLGVSVMFTTFFVKGYVDNTEEAEILKDYPEFDSVDDFNEDYEYDLNDDDYDDSDNDEDLTGISKATSILKRHRIAPINVYYPPSSKHRRRWIW